MGPNPGATVGVGGEALTAGLALADVGLAAAGGPPQALSSAARKAKPQAAWRGRTEGFIAGKTRQG